MGPCLFLPERLFRLSHCKTHWTVSMDYILGLTIYILGTSNFMLALTFFFPWCKLKWSWDKFYRALRQLHGPWCKQPLSHLCKSRTTPNISIIRSAIQWARTCLIFVHKVGKLGGGMWMWGADQLVVSILWWIIIQQYSCLTCDHLGDMTQPIFWH